jgi:hypothetical protein
VKFEDEFVKKTTYQNFLNGHVLKERIKPLSKRNQVRKDKIDEKLTKCKPDEFVGKTIQNKDGSDVEILDYDKYTGFKVKFSNGVIKDSISYTSIKNKEVYINSKKKKNNTKRKTRIGEKGLNTEGEEMTIISYDNANHMIVEFADGQRNECRYSNFKIGNVYKPSHRAYLIKQSKLGETSVSIDGEPIKIIDYIDYNNITVEFEDGSIRENVQYDLFKRGKVVKNSRVNGAKYRWLGQTKQTSSGDTITVVEYFSGRNITIAFSDGTLKHNVTTAQFKTGRIQKPGAPRKVYTKHIHVKEA